MSEDIREQINGLVGAIMRKDDEGAGTAAVILVGGALIDLRRIADAVSKLATDGPALTAEEAETVEALRRGDIKVVKAPFGEEGVIAYFKDHALHGKTGQVQWLDLSELERNEWRRRQWLDLSELERNEWRRRYRTFIGA